MGVFRLRVARLTNTRLIARTRNQANHQANTRPPLEGAMAWTEQISTHSWRVRYRRPTSSGYSIFSGFTDAKAAERYPSRPSITAPRDPCRENPTHPDPDRLPNTPRPLRPARSTRSDRRPTARALCVPIPLDLITLCCGTRRSGRYVICFEHRPPEAGAPFESGPGLGLRAPSPRNCRRQVMPLTTPTISWCATLSSHPGAQLHTTASDGQENTSAPTQPPHHRHAEHLIPPGQTLDRA